MKRALITGVAGQDGYYLARYLHFEHGYTVYGLGHGRHPSDEMAVADLPFLRQLPGDLTSIETLWKACVASQPDEVYNLGAASSVELSFMQPNQSSLIAGQGALNLLTAVLDYQSCSGHEVRFYQASTSEMFGNVGSVVKDESSPFAPRSFYGAAKLFAHNCVSIYRDSHNLHASSGICFNHESPRRGIQFVTRKVTRAAARIAYGLDVELQLGDPEIRRDWGFAGDYVEAMWAMLQTEEPGDFVVATGKSHSLRDLVELAFQFAGIDEHVDAVKWGVVHRPLDIDVLEGDASKARRVLGWKPKHTFEDLIQMMVEADLRHVKDRELDR